ncbi:MAG: ATP-binding protein [Actinomycetaceae bacterium]|nr:ATP-binding protein [Actinomycetaceae bacterium]
MLERSSYKELLRWKNQENKKALLVAGARQTGKTTLIREFGRREYKTTIEINFVNQPEAKKIFSGNYDPKKILSALTAFTRSPLTPRETLIFLDEIQECPEARTAIKFLVEDSQFDYIESGSLLGINEHTVPSLPVGFEQNLTLHPLDFYEFCLALSVPTETLELLETHFLERTPIPEPIHKTMLDIYRTYLVVGGMPQVVQTYVDTHDIGAVLANQKDIFTLYRADASKYAGRDKAKVRSILDALPGQLDEKNRRFLLSSLAPTARMERYENSFTWLSDAGIALPCYNVSQPSSPLVLNEKRSIFRLFMNDVGLLCSQNSANVQYSILSGDKTVNQGAIYENAFATQLSSLGHKLHYFDSKQHGEVDFVCESYSGAGLDIYEVKSGRSFRQHRAFDHVRSVKEWNFTNAIIFAQTNIENAQDDIGEYVYMPWYLSMFCKPQSIERGTLHHVDISALTK